MEDEDITHVPNRKGGQNLKDRDGYVFTKTKMMPLKDKNYWKLRTEKALERDRERERETERACERDRERGRKRCSMFDVRSHSRFGLSRFGPFRRSVFRCSVIFDI